MTNGAAVVEKAIAYKSATQGTMPIVSKARFKKIIYPIIIKFILS